MNAFTETYHRLKDLGISEDLNHFSVGLLSGDNKSVLIHWDNSGHGMLGMVISGETSLKESLRQLESNPWKFGNWDVSWKTLEKRIEKKHKESK